MLLVDLMAIISNELGTCLAKILVIDKVLSLFPLNTVSTEQKKV